MSLRERTSVRWLVPRIILLFVCAGLATLILKHYSSDSHPPATTPGLVESERASPILGVNGSLANLAVTNQPGVEAKEDRVVALITEGNQLLAQGNYAEAAHKYEQAVAISPDQEDLHYNLAIALAKLGKTAEAKNHYAEALRIFPDYWLLVYFAAAVRSETLPPMIESKFSTLAKPGYSAPQAATLRSKQAEMTDSGILI